MVYATSRPVKPGIGSNFHLQKGNKAKWTLK